MPYIFGAGATDKIDLPSPDNGLFGTNRAGLITCWVLPTTLTATRVLWAAGATTKLAVDTSTSQVRFTSDATTDGVFTAPAGLVVDTWTYVALLYLSGATSMNIRIWTGTPDTAPVERAITTVTGQSGATVGGVTTLTVGNTSSGSLAFQGEIGGVTWHVSFTFTPFGGIKADSDTTISQGQADAVYVSHVDPLWRGDLPQIAAHGRAILSWKAAATSPEGWQIAASFDTSGAPRIGTNGIVFPTITGATKSARTTPHPFRDNLHPLITPGSMRRCYTKVP